MKIDEKLFKLPFDTLTADEFSVFIKLLSQINEKTDVIKTTDDDLERLMKGNGGLGIGRDKTTQALSTLAQKGLITKEQKKNSAGLFDRNEIRIITNLVN